MIWIPVVKQNSLVNINSLLIVTSEIVDWSQTQLEKPPNTGLKDSNFNNIIGQKNS